MRFIYPTSLRRTGTDEVVVSFRDLPDCLTSEADEEEALAEAQDALAEAIASRINRRDSIPILSARKPGERRVAVPAGMAIKAAFALDCQRSGLLPDALAQRLGTDVRALRRMLDSSRTTSPTRINKAMRVLGGELVAELREHESGQPQPL